MDDWQDDPIGKIAQIAIDKLISRIGEAGIAMRLLSNVEGYLRTAQKLGSWVDPACAQQRGHGLPSLFWIEFTDHSGQAIALGAALKWQTEDILADIADGRLWFSGGFADHCALHHIDLADPSRLIHGTTSYMQLSARPQTTLPPEMIDQLSLLLQALAFRHHKPAYCVQLGVNSSQLNATPRLTDSFAHDDFLASTYFPPAETVVTLNLLHNSRADFVRLSGQAQASSALEHASVHLDA